LQTEFEDTKTGNQNPYIEEEQTTQCPKEKVKYIVCFEENTSVMGQHWIKRNNTSETKN
jgi:predicted metal-dependent hydrolase